jgi:hypothetical protein
VARYRLTYVCLRSCCLDIGSLRGALCLHLRFLGPPPSRHRLPVFASAIETALAELHALEVVRETIVDGTLISRSLSPTLAFAQRFGAQVDTIVDGHSRGMRRIRNAGDPFSDKGSLRHATPISEFLSSGAESP